VFGLLANLHGRSTRRRAAITITSFLRRKGVSAMSQRGQLIRLKRMSGDGEPLWAYRYRLARLEAGAAHRYGDASTAILDADLAAADWYIVPTVRADAILSPLVIGRDDHDEPTIEQAQELRRVPVSSGEKLSASPRSTSEFFGVIRPVRGDFSRGG